MFELSKMSFEIAFAVHGYHIYKVIWEVEISSELLCLPESDNCEDRNVAVILQLFQSSWYCFFSSRSSS